MTYNGLQEACNDLVSDLRRADADKTPSNKLNALESIQLVRALLDGAERLLNK